MVLPFSKMRGPLSGLFVPVIVFEFEPVTIMPAVLFGKIPVPIVDLPAFVALKLCVGASAAWWVPKVASAGSIVLNFHPTWAPI